MANGTSGSRARSVRSGRSVRSVRMRVSSMIAFAAVATLGSASGSATIATASSPPHATATAEDTLRDEAKKRLAQIDGTITIPGLDSAVEVRRDRWGVPHIYA